MTKNNKIFTIMLRFLGLIATISAIIVMVTSHDEAQVMNLTFKAKYNHTPAFRYFVIAEAVAAGYTIIAMFLSSNTLVSRFFVILDVLATMLLTSSISSALAVAQVGKKGNSYAGWLPICGQVPKFCDQVTGALVAGFVALLIYLVIILKTIYPVTSLLAKS